MIQIKINIESVPDGGISINATGDSVDGATEQEVALAERLRNTINAEIESFRAEAGYIDVAKQKTPGATIHSRN